LTNKVANFDTISKEAIAVAVAAGGAGTLLLQLFGEQIKDALPSFAKKPQNSKLFGIF